MRNVKREDGTAETQRAQRFAEVIKVISKKQEAIKLFRIPHSAFRTPHSARGMDKMKRTPEETNLPNRGGLWSFRIPHSAFRIAFTLPLLGAIFLGVQLLGATPEKAGQGVRAPIPVAPTSQVLCVDDGGGVTGSPCSNPTAYTLIQD